jgi:large subunit ribosomal protein L40
MRSTTLQQGCTCIASSSRQTVVTRALPSIQSRNYATPPSNPHLAAPSDTRVEVIRRALYPADTHLPNSAAPTGAYHPNYAARLQRLIPDPEVYETIDRAWQLHQRQLRDASKKSLAAKYKAMQEACDQLDKITAEGSGGRWPRTLYARAMARPTMRGQGGGETGKKATSESRWLDARIDGLVPREAWIPTETRGKGWNYDWKRPSK